MGNNTKSKTSQLPLLLGVRLVGEVRFVTSSLGTVVHDEVDGDTETLQRPESSRPDVFSRRPPDSSDEEPLALLNAHSCRFLDCNAAWDECFGADIAGLKLRHVASFAEADRIEHLASRLVLTQGTGQWRFRTNLRDARGRGFRAELLLSPIDSNPHLVQVRLSNRMPRIGVMHESMQVLDDFASLRNRRRSSD